jgi:2-(1,2-epoxy-1,2-dihydrophenyl)acetyl-CoA isomerase
LIPAIIGPAKAWELFTWRGELTAEDAREIGLVNRVFPDDVLFDESKKLALKLAIGPTLAFVRTKELINNYISGSTLDHHLNMELKFQKEMAKTYDFKEGINAFLEKRMAQFEGK